MTTPATTTLAELKALNSASGGAWFERGTIRLSRTKLHGPPRVATNKAGLAAAFFITSELPPLDARRYSVRRMDLTGPKRGEVQTVIGNFCVYTSEVAARAAMQTVVLTFAAH